MEVFCSRISGPVAKTLVGSQLTLPKNNLEICRTFLVFAEYALKHIIRMEDLEGTICLNLATEISAEGNVADRHVQLRARGHRG